MTEYRTISDGYCDWLQYKTINIVGFWIFKRMKVVWNYIRTDYYDYFDEQWENWEKEYGNEGGLRDHDRYINSYNTDLERFVKKYPDVNRWLIQRARTVKEKRQSAHAYHKQIALQIGATKYFKQ